MSPHWETEEQVQMRISVAVLAAITVFAPAFAADHPGKAVYSRSCQNCHGPEGQGSNVANSFFQMQIPRLASNKVQMRTNPELKEIILRGSGRMEPVRMGRPTTPHGKTKKLTEQQIEDVIAYVRTFSSPGSD
jgi:mono/diheme cytochrome c family protein